MHDPIAAHIFDALYPRHGPLPKNTINTIARKDRSITLYPPNTPLTQTCEENITFLVKYHGAAQTSNPRASRSASSTSAGAEIGHKSHRVRAPRAGGLRGRGMRASRLGQAGCHWVDGERWIGLSGRF